jgi:hypothetical protein
VDIVGLSLPVFVGNDVVACSGVEGSRVLGRVGTLELGPGVGGCGDLVPSERGGGSVPWLGLDR